ncbi:MULTISPECIES: pyrroline-5-carboxylate reductase [unclassified Campylobacter]|uniref:pyrroline-5-carboxylate reductase n=1 Tax=unclassified Campylobacter TaxID=2593542 RepID=UPI001E12BF49|nr:pyrroline-5-carboxylate reductase [Campylobacter sp. RM12637]MBZ7992812.1 pyrroline-5-carboxylate reductase [Campylobacter sp. RM9333]
MNENIYILGNGKMAKAIAKGLENSNFNVVFVVRNKLNVGIKNCISYEEFDITNKICILCFKPYNLDEVSKKFLGKTAKIIISPLAGISIDSLKVIASEYYLKIMPNIAAEYNKSCTTYVGDKTHKYFDLALNIIKGFGVAIECENENELNLAMAINGCAPAFLALVAEALANGGVSIGLKNDKSYELVKSLFASFESLIANNHPALIKEGVCSPAGVSIKGVNVLEDEAVRSAFIKAIKASANKN